MQRRAHGARTALWSASGRPPRAPAAQGGRSPRRSRKSFTRAPALIPRSRGGGRGTKPSHRHLRHRRGITARRRVISRPARQYHRHLLPRLQLDEIEADICRARARVASATVSGAPGNIAEQAGVWCLQSQQVIAAVVARPAPARRDPRRAKYFRRLDKKGIVGRSWCCRSSRRRRRRGHPSNMALNRMEQAMPKPHAVRHRPTAIGQESFVAWRQLRRYRGFGAQGRIGGIAHDWHSG